MSSTGQPPETPATSLFPQFKSRIYSMITAEVDGLTEEQLDFESDRWEWSKWSIRRNVSHVASGDFRWLLVRWGEVLFPDGLPDLDDLDGAIASPYDRRLDERKYWKLEDILSKLRQGLGLCWSVLSSETAGSLRAKELRIDTSEQWRLFAKTYSEGVRQDPGDTEHMYITLEATFHHRWFEYTTHLYNMQRLKKAQGLAATVDIPREGYWAMPEWDRNEP